MQTKNKDGFILYKDQKTLINKLSDEQAGKLIKAIYEYEDTGETPNFDLVLDIVFTSIKTTLDKNRQKYAEKCKKYQENIKKRWGKDTTEYNGIPPNTNYTDIDNDIDKDIDKEEYHNNDDEDGSCDDDPILFFQKNFNNGKKLSDYQLNALSTFCDEIGEELVVYAMKKCVDYNALSFQYLKSIINNWKKAEVKSIEEAEKVDAKFQKTKKLSGTKFKNVNSTYNDEILETLYDN